MAPGLLEYGATKLMEEAFGASLRAFLAGKADEAREVYLKRMGRGSMSAMLSDREAFNTWVYFRKAADGAARRNLDLIAQAMRADLDEPTLIEEDRKRVFDALASLSREEAIILGVAVRALAMHHCGDLNGDEVWPYVRDTLVANPLFGSPDVLSAHAYALVRTGWIVPVSTYGGQSLQPTPRLSVVARMVNFEDPDVVAS